MERGEGTKHQGIDLMNVRIEHAQVVKAPREQVFQAWIDYTPCCQRDSVWTAISNTQPAPKEA